MKQIVAAKGPIHMHRLLPWKFLPPLNCCEWGSQKARQNESIWKCIWNDGISVYEYRIASARCKCSETNWTCDPHPSNRDFQHLVSSRMTVVWILWQWTWKHRSDEEWQWLPHNSPGCSLGREGGLAVCVQMRWCCGGLILYVFWGSGEMGPGVLVPSILCTGIWNWGVRTDGNWNRAEWSVRML